MNGDAVTLLVGGAGKDSGGRRSPYYDAILRFDTAGQGLTAVVPLLFMSDGHTVDRANNVFFNDTDGNLRKVDATGKTSQVAPSMLAKRPGKECGMQLLVDDRLIHGVMNCKDGPAEIVRVSKDGGRRWSSQGLKRASAPFSKATPISSSLQTGRSADSRRRAGPPKC